MENCPFWLRMADTRSLCPLGLLWKLSVIIGGHLFEIATVVLALESLGAYPLLLGRPWLRSANIKQKWQYNHLSFHRGRAKVKVPMEESAPAPKEISPLYAEEINMLKRLEDEELERCREDPITRHGSRGGTAGVLDRKDSTLAQALARRDLRKIEREIEIKL